MELPQVTFRDSKGKALVRGVLQRGVSPADVMRALSRDALQFSVDAPPAAEAKPKGDGKAAGANAGAGAGAPAGTGAGK